MKQIKLHLKNEILEGILVKEDDKHLTLKLVSGYNIGIEKHKIERIEEIREITHTKTEIKATQDSALPKVLIIHTGGTIASKVDYQTGAVTARFSPEELIDMFPELKDLAKIESKLMGNMASDDMRFAHYNLMAKEIEKNKDVKGIIITHGTDTIHYTSAALSFIFEHLPIPVVLVGSQRSSDRGSSDSAMNLISAVAFIANTSLKGVFICMHESMDDENCIILNGLNAKKLHSSRRDAFKPINVKPIARVSFSTKEIEYISEYPSSSLNAEGKLKIHLFNESLKIGIMVSHPNMFASEFGDYDGLILEGTGLGHFPINEIDEMTSEHTKIKEKLMALSKKIPVVMTLQTVYGSVNMNIYTPGRKLIEMGVIGNLSSLNTETAFIKLAWLLSQKLDPHEWFMKEIRGEIRE